MENNKKKTKEPQRNVEVNDATWKNAGILAAQLGIKKKEVVTQALDFYYKVNQFKN